MTFDVYVPFVVAALLGLTSPYAARRLSPALASRVLTTASAACAATSTWALGLLAGGALATGTGAEHPAGAAGGEPVPDLAGWGAVAVLGVGVFRLARAIRREWGLRGELRRMGQACPDGELIVVESEVPEAFAVPGGAGRIVVTSTMLAALDADERRAMLAHERAHLRHSHHRLALVMDVSAALNPLLVPVRTVVDLLLERWADEVAAETVGDRRLVARSLARAALAGTGHQGSGRSFTSGSVAARVAALHGDPRASVRLVAGAVGCMALGATGFTAEATLDLAELLRLALPFG